MLRALGESENWEYEKGTRVKVNFFNARVMPTGHIYDRCTIDKRLYVVSLDHEFCGKDTNGLPQSMMLCHVDNLQLIE